MRGVSHIRIRHRASAALAATLALTSACSTMSMPVLRHETGEPLGGIGHFRFSGFYESSRIFEFVPPGGIYTVVQGNSIFQGSVIGGRVEAGLLKRLDVQGGAFFTGSGGGWRVGSKFTAFTKGDLSIAAMVAYETGSGNGSITYQTVAGTSDAPLTISAYTVDLSAPVSYRLSPELAAYGSLMLLRSGVFGESGGNEVSTVAWDIGMSFGVRVTISRIEFDLEGAMLRLYDPFADSATRLVPFFGVGAGISF